MPRSSDDELDSTHEGSQTSEASKVQGFDLPDSGDDDDDDDIHNNNNNPFSSSHEDSAEEAGTNDGDMSEEDGFSSSDITEPETQAEIDRKAAFFDADGGTPETHSSFLTMNLSRPILKAVTTLGFNKPTPIQATTIPVALLGKDVVGSAVTGSGKTAAFIIPMLERLLYRDKGKKATATRCLVLVPTRELAVQCFEVGTRLATHTDIRLCLIVGMWFSMSTITS
jgi:ATP-dependent RNA helicase DDX27